MSVIIAFILGYVGYLWPAFIFFSLLYILMQPETVRTFLKKCGFDVDESRRQWDGIAKDFGLKKNEDKVKATDKDGNPLN